MVLIPIPCFSPGKTLPSSDQWPWPAIDHPVEASDMHVSSEFGSKGSVDACLKN